MEINKLTQGITQKIKFSTEFVTSLKQDNNEFLPLHDGLNDAGKNIKLGFSCYGLKYYYLTGLWDDLNDISKKQWIDNINSYQKNISGFPANSYIDSNYLKYLNEFHYKKFLKRKAKSLLSITGIKKLDSHKVFESKSINAETKQAISTLFQVNYRNPLKVEPEFDSKSVVDYLDNLDWSQPWASGAQFSSLCVYAVTQDTYDTDYLRSFSDNLVDTDTGFYFKREPRDQRELFNGAMKIISGLDWLGHEIHYPKKIIDFCLKNTPIYEGCDIVDFIYILNKCLNSVEYRRKEVIELLIKLSEKMNILFNDRTGGYSYFEDKSQTHYYGVNISKGLNTSDLHATLLCNWGNVMILDILGEIGETYKTIKP